MRLVTVQGYDTQEVESLGSSSMSGFDEDLGDLELVLRREINRLDVLPNIVIREANEDAIEEYCARFANKTQYMVQIEFSISVSLLKSHSVVS